MAGNARNALDVQNALGRDALLRPPRRRRLVHADQAGKVRKTEATMNENASKVGVHEVERCATSNQCQGPSVRFALTPVAAPFGSLAAMDKTASIHARRQPRRPHHIEDWAERRGLRQVDIVEQLGADKSVVSRWFKGSTPSEEWQEKLAALFHCDPESLFRHPDEDWLKRFMQQRSLEEVERMKQILEAAFPQKTGTAA